MNEFIDNEVVRRTACPKCLVPAGIYCSTRGGRQIKSPHVARMNLHCYQGSNKWKKQAGVDQCS
jgi:hypothetical protein